MPTNNSTKKKSPSAAERKRRAEQSEKTAPPAPVSKGRGGGWLKGAALNHEELNLPSGATCLVMRPTPEQIIAFGIVDKMDALTAQVDKELVQPITGPMATKHDFMGSKLTGQQIIDSIELADRLCAAVCIDPPVLLAPVPLCLECGWEGANVKDHQPEDKHSLALKPRDPEAYYTDGIDIQDKLFILTHVMQGTMAMAPFPEDTEPGVGDIPPSEDMALSTE